MAISTTGGAPEKFWKLLWKEWNLKDNLKNSKCDVKSNVFSSHVRQRHHLFVLLWIALILMLRAFEATLISMYLFIHDKWKSQINVIGTISLYCSKLSVR